MILAQNVREFNLSVTSMSTMVGLKRPKRMEQLSCFVFTVAKITNGAGLDVPSS